MMLYFLACKFLFNSWESEYITHETTYAYNMIFHALLSVAFDPVDTIQIFWIMLNHSNLLNYVKWRIWSNIYKRVYIIECLGF